LTRPSFVATLMPERRAALDRQVCAELPLMDLRELRKLAGKTQGQVADLTEWAQGELEVTAVLGSERVALEGVLRHQLPSLSTRRRALPCRSRATTERIRDRRRNVANV
jgi:hypothetical protein